MRTPLTPQDSVGQTQFCRVLLALPSSWPSPVEPVPLPWFNTSTLDINTTHSDNSIPYNASLVHVRSGSGRCLEHAWNIRTKPTHYCTRPRDPLALTPMPHSQPTWRPPELPITHSVIGSNRLLEVRNVSTNVPLVSQLDELTAHYKIHQPKSHHLIDYKASI